MRRAAKVDANQDAIVRALRCMGFTVQHLHAVGAGCPDILAGRRGVNFLIEIKDGDKAPSARKLTPDQDRWHSEWRGQAVVINSVEEAVEWGNEVTK